MCERLAYCRTKDANSRNGVAALEMAISMVVLLPLLLGVFDASLIMFRRTLVSSAAERIARHAVVHGALAKDVWGPAPVRETGKAIEASRRKAIIGLDLDDVDVLLQWDGGNAVANEVTVTVSTTYAPMTPYIFSGQSVKLTATSIKTIAH